MMANKNGESKLARFSNDYGMVFVLLILGALFTFSTISWQYPRGSGAGVQVAKKILSEHGSKANVLVVAGGQGADPAFAAAAAKHLEDAGATVLETIADDNPRVTRLAIEKILAEGKSIDAIATTGRVSKWSLFDVVSDDISSQQCVPPERYRWPVFLKTSNLLGVANQTAIYAIIAIGMTMVIVSAGIDLSVGSLIALASVTTAIMIRDFGDGKDSSVAMVVFAMAAGVAVCALAGLFTGAVVTAFRMPSFIVTLAIMMMASGLAFRLSDGKSIGDLPPALEWLGVERSMGVPNAVWLMIVLYVIFHIVMSRTVGGNEEAARLSGVPVRRVQLAVYTICGALAGLGGIVLTSKLGAGDPKFGKGYELEVIAAVVVGGASLMGGRGKVFGTLIGALIIAVIRNGMNLMNINTFDKQIVLGAVLLVAVLVDTLKSRGGSK